MEFFEAIQKRHSYRGAYEDIPIPREDLRHIVQAGIQAPSGINLQTTSFVIVDDANLVAQIHAMHKMQLAMQQAKAYIVCIMDRNLDANSGLSFQVEDCAAAVENMLLAITALGYASVWIDGWLRGENRADIIGDLLGIPKNKIVRVLLPIGVPTTIVTQREKKSFEERAWFNRYGM